VYGHGQTLENIWSLSIDVNIAINVMLTDIDGHLLQIQILI